MNIIFIEKKNNIYDELVELIAETFIIEKTTEIMMEVHAGTGGDDARELAGMSFKSYQKFLSSYQVNILIYGAVTGIPGIGTGILTAKIPLHKIQGENGIHRLVRVNNGKKQTSFVSVFIYPM